MMRWFRGGVRWALCALPFLSNGCAVPLQRSCPRCQALELGRRPAVPFGTRTVFLLVPGLLGYGWEWDAAQAELAKLLGDAPRDEWIGAHEGMALHTDVLERRAAGHTTAMPTGLADLDELLEGGVRPGEWVTLLARSLEQSDYVSTCIGQVIHGDEVKALAVFEVILLD